MEYRKLRIAWSVAWGVLAVLLIVLWVRSYWWMDGAVLLRNDIVSLQGTLFVDEVFGLTSSDTTNIAVMSVKHHWGFSYQLLTVNVYPNGIGHKCPYWPIVSLILVLSCAPWILLVPMRFSLRTLLIGMTVAAIGLGWVVYAMRS